MPIFQRSVKTIQHADDGPGPLGAGEDTDALTWDNGTGKFVMSPGGGGGVSLDAANTWTRRQALGVSVDDATSLGGEELTNGDFETNDLTGWTDDASGWSVTGGNLIHTPGVFGELTQALTPSVTPGVYVLEVKVSGMTTGYTEIYDDFNFDLLFTDNGTSKAIASITGADTIYIDVSSDFDGQIEYVSLRYSVSGFPANITLNDSTGNAATEIRSINGALYWGLNSGKLSQNGSNIGIGNNTLDAIVDEAGNVALGTGAGSGAIVNDTIMVGTNAGSGAAANGGLYMGVNSGSGETTDKKLHLGNGGDIISGTMDGGSAATQMLKFHASICNFADVPTSAAGLNPGDLWNDGGVAKFA